MAVDWGYFDKFEEITDKYLPDMGEGETMATQIVTAVCKIIYRWYNDGDVYDNQVMTGWCNNLSSYANWLDQNAGAEYLYGIYDCNNYGDYEDILQELADKLLQTEVLEDYDKKPKQGSIYDCDGDFKFIEWDEEEDDEDWY